MQIIRHNTIEQNEITASEIIDILSQNNCTLMDVEQCLNLVNDILKYQKISPSAQILNYRD